MSNKQKKDSEAKKQQQNAEELVRDGRRFSVGTHREGAKRKIRYIESNDPKKNCRFL